MRPNKGPIPPESLLVCLFISYRPTTISTTYASVSFGTFRCHHITVTTSQNIYFSTFVLLNAQGDAPILGQSFRCEYLHCPVALLETGYVVLFSVVLVSAQLVGGRSSAFIFLEKIISQVAWSGKNPEILACLHTTRLRARELLVVANVSIQYGGVQSMLLSTVLV